MSARARLTLRASLVLIALVQTLVGAWALLGPRSFYDNVVGVSLLPPYNEHLTTDVGGLNLALALVFAVAAVSLDRLLVRTALAGYLLYTVPHLVFHSTHLEGFDSGTAIVQNTGLAVVALLPLGLLALTRRRPTIAGLDHVQVAAPPGCEEAARRFYGGLLGLAEVAKPAPMRASGGAWFSLGAQQLHVGVAEPFAPSRKGHPGLAVPGEGDLDALAARLEATGAPVRWDDRLPGVRRFYTEDPWGNRLELLVGGAPAPGEDAQRAEG